MDSRLNLFAPPHPLLVAAEVLALVTGCAAVDAAQVWQCLSEVVAWYPHPQDVGWDSCHYVVGQVERLRVKCRIAVGRGAERIEMSREVAVSPVRLDERCRCLDGLQHVMAWCFAGAARV